MVRFRLSPTKNPVSARSGAEALGLVMALTFAFALAGCGHGGAGGAGGGAIGPPGSSDEGEIVLLRPHWDQVCRNDRAPRVLREVDEAMDVSGDDPVSFVDQMLPAGRSGAPAPFVDVAVTYEASGTIRTVHLSDHNVDPSEAAGIVEMVSDRVHELPGLIQPVFLRVRATRAPEPRLELLPGLHCLPHVQHEEGEPPPRFLAGARVLGGGSLRGNLGDAALRVRLDIAPTGDLVSIDPVEGNSDFLDAVREGLHGVRFDPALLNGEPIRGELDLVFFFSEDP